MADNNVQNVRFLRNGTLFTSREQATSALTNFTLTSEMDGSSILARYQVGTGPIKTLVGYVYYKDASNNSVTIFDVDDAGSDVDEKIRTAIEALDSNATSVDGKNVQVKVTETDGKITAVNITTDNTVNSGDVATAIETEIGKLEYSDTAVAGQYVSQVSETDGKIAVVRVDLPSLTEVKETGKPIVAVSENKGQVAASVGTINAEFVNIADSGSLITATTVEGALSEIAAEIDAMDKTASAEDGKVVTTISETDGVVSETKANVKDLQLGGYSKDTSATGNIASGDTINVALSKLENKAAAITITNADGSINVTTGASGTDINVNIKSNEHVIAKDGNAGLYTDIKLSAVTPSSTTVKEEYSLVGTDGTVLGTNIKIYKDSSIVSITYITDPADEHYQNLKYVYIDASGDTKTEYVNMSTLVIEAEFESGVTANTAGVVHGVVDTTSEKNSSSNSFLTVGANGFKVDGIKDEIDTKINALDATVGSTTVATGNHVAVEVVEDAGKLTALTVTENDIANATDLSALSGKSVTAVEMTGGTAAIAANSTDGAKKITINTDGSQILMTGYESGSTSGAVEATDSINAAIGKLENQIAGKVDALDATVSGQTTDGKVKVQVVQENGVLTAVTVTGTDIASADALAAEIAARKAVDGQTGQTYAANASANYISDAGSLNDADVKLDVALKTADDAMLTGVTAGNGITVSTKENKSQKISAKVKNDGGIVNDTDGLHLGYIDAGIY